MWEDRFFFLSEGLLVHWQLISFSFLVLIAWCQYIFVYPFTRTFMLFAWTRSFPGLSSTDILSTHKILYFVHVIMGWGLLVQCRSIWTVQYMNEYLISSHVHCTHTINKLHRHQRQLVLSTLPIVKCVANKMLLWTLKANTIALFGSRAKTEALHTSWLFFCRQHVSIFSWEQRATCRVQYRLLAHQNEPTRQ